MNNSLNRQLHALLTSRNVMKRKQELVLSYTRGRTDSSADMTDKEAIELIGYLRTLPDPSETMRRKIISMAHECGWHSFVAGRWIIDMNRLDAWMLKSSYLKKRLNAYKYNELPKLVTQFEEVYKSFLKRV